MTHPELPPIGTEGVKPDMLKTPDGKNETNDGKKETSRLNDRVSTAGVALHMHQPLMPVTSEHDPDLQVGFRRLDLPYGRNLLIAPRSPKRLHRFSPT